MYNRVDAKYLSLSQVHYLLYFAIFFKIVVTQKMQNHKNCIQEWI